MYKEISSASIADRNYTYLRLFIAKRGVVGLHYFYLMLLVPISFFLCLVDYALEGSTFSLSKCDFSRLFHTESHGTHIDLLCLSFLAGRICPLMHEHFL